MPKRRRRSKAPSAWKRPANPVSALKRTTNSAGLRRSSKGPRPGKLAGAIRFSADTDRRALEKHARVGIGRRHLERLDACFARADADDLGQIADEDLTVADAAGPGRFDDRVHDVRNDPFRDDHFDVYFGNEIHGVFGP